MIEGKIPAWESFNLDKTADGLLPAIVQDELTLKVLMLGYMNRESYLKTVESGLVCFWSRSRRCLLTKGETSGNFLHVKSLYADCDNDTVLVKARPDGPVCHRGTPSCFDTEESEGFVRRLSGVVSERHANMPEGSYTTKLFIKGIKTIAKKVGEESTEAIIEAVSGKRDRFIYETCDLIYHYLVMLEQMGINLSEIESELEARHR